MGILVNFVEVILSGVLLIVLVVDGIYLVELVNVMILLVWMDEVVLLLFDVVCYEVVLVVKIVVLDVVKMKWVG